MSVLSKPCTVCGATILKTPSYSMRAWTERRRYCSRECADEAKRGKTHRPEHVEKIRRAATGRRHSAQSIAKMQGENAHRWRGGKPKCSDCGARVANPSAKRCLACARKAMVGEAAPNWRGGTTPINAKIRNSPEMASWRVSVFERDDYTCQCCAQRGGKLHADHIEPFALFPELRTQLSNGRTLCVRCHREYGALVRSGRLIRPATVIKAVAA